MGMGSLTLACVLMLANGVEQPKLPPSLTPGAERELFHMKSGKMAIPITIDPALRNELREVVLFCSKDEGKTWQQAGLATPEQLSFPFTAPSDGKYWFTIQTIDKKGVKAPPDVYSALDIQKINVDTVKPVVKLRAERKGEEIVVNWEVTEDYPNSATFVVEYHQADQPSAIWTPLPAMPGPTGSTMLKPAPATAVTVQLRVKDMAENEGSGTAEVAAGSSQFGSGIVTTSGKTPDTTPWTPPAPSPMPTPAPGPVALPVSPGPVTPPIPYPTPAITTGSTGLPPAVTTPLRGGLPAKMLINKPEVKLDFDVTNLGPSGFGTVDVYVTTDEGANWTPLAVEPSAIQAPEARNPGQVRGGVQVRVPEDGKVFGFYLVVKSRALLGKPAPRSGDMPHIRLERDMICPSATLKVPQPDPTHRDTLILTWEAADKNLTDKPISLEWAPRSDGPWEYIGGPELPNSGKYAWSVPPTAPPSVYLKLTVRDGAGNVAVAQSEKPVLVDLSVPEVAGVSVSPSR